MLRLGSATPPHWGAWAVEHVDEILLDHAHCEKKAASTAIALIFRYQDRPALMAPLSALAREELEHFEQVLTVLAGRGLSFGRQEPSPYAARLMRATRTHEPARLLDTLLCCALIEARSCDRMQHLARALREVGQPELAAFYTGLLACEARHHQTYVDLAAEVGEVSMDALRERLADLAAHEAEICATPVVEPRLHNAGPPLG